MKFVKVALPDEYNPATDKVWYGGEKYQAWQPIYRDVLDKGFLGLIDFMGGDDTVVNAARVSYGAGTKRVSEDRNLIRYLIRNRHWTPVEMVEIMWHVKAPIFVYRQWHRHRAASINEYSARYSIMSDDMYMPEQSVMKQQSATNKQGRGDDLSENNAYACQLQLQHVYQECFQGYEYLLGKTATPSTALNTRYDLIKQFAMQQIALLEKNNPDWHPEKVTEQMINDKMAEIIKANGLAFTDEEFLDNGLSRELARIAMPLSTYSEMYWKSDLRNTFNFIGLRSDPHAQHEIREYSNLMLEMLEPIAPICVAAFIDYQLKGRQFSKFEIEVIRHLYKNLQREYETGPYVDVAENIDSIMKEAGASKREINDFLNVIRS